MEPALKQRLVGAVVLVALAVIFVPMVLEGPAEQEGISESNIPPPPEVAPMPEVPAPGRERDAAEADGPPPQQESEGPAASGAEGDASAPPPAASGAPSDAALTGWVVQVGSFSTRQNAVRLRDRLRDQGFATFVEEASTDQGEVYRVKAGPELSRERAEALRKAIEKEVDLKGLVMEHS